MRRQSPAVKSGLLSAYENHQKRQNLTFRYRPSRRPRSRPARQFAKLKNEPAVPPAAAALAMAPAKTKRHGLRWQSAAATPLSRARLALYNFARTVRAIQFSD